MSVRIVSTEQYDNMTSKEICGDAWAGPQVEAQGKVVTLELSDGHVLHPVCNVETSRAGAKSELISIDRTWYTPGTGIQTTVRHYFSAEFASSNESPLVRLSDLLMANPSIDTVAMSLMQYILKQNEIWSSLSEC